MRSRRVAMSFEEYELLPRKPGWKQEYYGGRLHMTPRHTAVVVRAPVLSVAVPTTQSRLQRPVTPDDAPALTRAFYEAFRNTVEFCDWKEAAIVESAEKSIRTYFAGKRGSPHPASRISVAASNPATLTGAALLVQSRECACLDILFIRPRWQRRGVATALLGAAMQSLHQAGETQMESAYDLANEASRAWHEGMGFVELPDLHLARLRASDVRHELWRREQMNTLSTPERERLEQERALWEVRVEELETIADRDGYEAVTPFLRRRP